MPDFRSGSIGMLAAIISGLLMADPAGDDVRRTPPEVRTFASPDRKYTLTVRGTAKWREVYGRAELTTAGPRVIWSHPLPHRLGPRDALVAPNGRTVLLDEWVRTPGPLAILLLDETGKEVARHSVDAIATAAGLDKATVVKKATEGSWMSAPAAPDYPHGVVRFRAADVGLVLDLTSGRLTREAVRLQ